MNLSTPLAVELVPLVGGLGYDSDAFFPIDDELLGNEGREHNFHFIVEAHGHFRYKVGEVFSFTGDDHLWAFINGRFVMDLGGVHSVKSGEFELGNLDLDVGEVYSLDIFFAERHTSKCSASTSARDVRAGPRPSPRWCRATFTPLRLSRGQGSGSAAWLPDHAVSWLLELGRGASIDSC